MSYRALELLPKPSPRVEELVRRLEDHFFRDIHAMLRLPAPSLEITAGCNFAIAQVLAAVVSGISVTLYAQSGSKGSRFMNLLVEYYPWSEEPIPERNDAEHARMIYKLFRNPLTHDLGLDLESKMRTRKVVIKRLTTADDKAGRTERGVEGLESNNRPSGLSPVLSLEGDRVVLLVDALYWGVRKMLVELCADTSRVAEAERFLASMGSDTLHFPATIGQRQKSKRRLRRTTPS